VILFFPTPLHVKAAMELTEIAASVSASERPKAYLKYLNDLLQQPQSAITASSLRQKLTEYLDEAVFGEANSQGGGLMVGRQALSDFSEAIARVAKGSSGGDDGDQVMKSAGDEPAILDEDVQREVLEIALEKVQPRVLSFEEQVSLSHGLFLPTKSLH
jgi:COP9 signalosome complex subunit 4